MYILHQLDTNNYTIRECGSSLYVEMAHVFFVPIHWYIKLIDIEYKEPTCVDIMVSVLGTIGYGNIMNSIWIINNSLHSNNGERISINS